MPYINNKDIAIRYELGGDKTKPVLVLIFGISMSCEDWFELQSDVGLDNDLVAQTFAQGSEAWLSL